MLELQAALPIGRNESIVAVGQPDESVIEELKLRSGKVVKDIFDAPNEIWLSPPRTYDMLALWSLDHKRPPLLIAADAQDSDFILVEFNCSFLPAKECEFIRALLRIWLMPDPPAREGDAIAYDMFPGEVRTPTTVKRTYSFSPELKLKFTKEAGASVSGGKVEQSQEYLVYEPEITTAALGDRAPAWEFNKTKAEPIRGSRSLFLVVQKPKGGVLYGRFELSATIRSKLLGRIPLPSFFHTGGTKPLISEKYRISP